MAYDPGWESGWTDYGQATGAGLGLAGTLSSIPIPGLQQVGWGLSLISGIAKMIGQRKAEEEAEKQRKKQEALQRATWLSQRRERAAGEWF